MDRLAEALDGMSSREVEKLVELAQKRLQRCLVCDADGADAVRAVKKGGTTPVSLLLCPACFEKHRLPEGRSEGAGG